MEKIDSLVLKALMSCKNIEGYKVMKFPHEENSYFFVITPKNNVLCISRTISFGLDCVLKYVPSRKNGQGCKCNDEPFYKVTKELLETLENEGLKFASYLGAKRYKNPETFFRRYCYRADELVEAV